MISAATCSRLGSGTITAMEYLLTLSSAHYRSSYRPVSKYPSQGCTKALWAHYPPISAHLSTRLPSPLLFAPQQNPLKHYPSPSLTASLHSLPIPRTTDLAAAAAQGTRLPSIRTQARSATILPNFVGLRFAVHNGKGYSEIEISEDMVGRKLGEFVATRKRFVYRLSKNK